MLASFVLNFLTMFAAFTGIFFGGFALLVLCSLFVELASERPFVAVFLGSTILAVGAAAIMTFSS